LKLELPELYDPNDLLAEAVNSFREINKEQFIQVWLNGQKEAPYLASYFTRTFNQMPNLEKEAMKLTYGKTLDIGAGAGPHTTYLLNKGIEVHSLELNSLHCNGLREIPNSYVIEQDFFAIDFNEKYDTILLLMNGFGICQKQENLLKMGEKLKEILAQNGQILVEITDYSYSDFYDHDIVKKPSVTFRLKYGEKFSKEFNWFYPKLGMVQNMCEVLNLNMEKIFQEEEMLLLKLSFPD